LTAALIFDCDSIETAHQMLGPLTAQRYAHSITIISEDGSVAERWFQLNGQWSRKALGGRRNLGRLARTPVGASASEEGG
jgi:hypothetical protein